MPDYLADTVATTCRRSCRFRTVSLADAKLVTTT